MTSQVTERRLQRAAAQQVFDALAVDYFDVTDVSRGHMFGSEGLVVKGKFFAFVGREGQLIVKLPPLDASALVAGGEATAVRAGRATTREWVGIPMAVDGPAGRWRDLVGATYRYVLSQAGSAMTKP